jgi:transposase-like protein
VSVSIRNSTTLASWKDRKDLAASLKPVYQAANADLAAAALDEFAERPWGTKFPTVAAMWRRQWQQVIPYFAYSPCWINVYGTCAPRPPAKRTARICCFDFN